jgi:hypothetical protein
MQVRLDIFNVGNLINSKWGRQLLVDQSSTCGANCSAVVLFTQTGFSPAPNRIPVVTFDTNAQPYSAQSAASNYRLQLSVRYSF